MSLTASAGGRGGAEVGEHLKSLGQKVAVRAHVRGVPSATVSLHTDRGKVHREKLPSHGTGTAEWLTTAQESAFVQVEYATARAHGSAHQPDILT
ncbi:hypothetical protein [Streptomyces sp. NBC_00624]|uniref:hypothetical protein n=1 Tax=Streptomyces sp. NBC_00624 TaxID=2975791 RepID=UPI0030E5C4DF